VSFDSKNQPHLISSLNLIVYGVWKIKKAAENQRLIEE
jgi:hypothetical protein